LIEVASLIIFSLVACAYAFLGSTSNLYLSFTLTMVVIDFLIALAFENFEAPITSAFNSFGANSLTTGAPRSRVNLDLKGSWKVKDLAKVFVFV